jgi:phenylpropionate dioxygenase-like ring-hydroxylating dioxygenase large terminal subunit
VDEDGYVRVAASGDVGGPPFLRVELAGHPVLLARLDDGGIRAFAAGCPHLGQPLTHGILGGRTLECPFHFYAYDLDTGRNAFPGDADDLALPLHHVVERDGEVFLRITG